MNCRPRFVKFLLQLGITPMKAIILAGGFATRLWPITESRAKPLLSVAGKEIISYLVEQIPKDIEIIISTNQVFAKDFMRWKENIERSISIFIEDSDGEEKKKGALGAVALAIEKKKIKEDIFLLAGDNLVNFSFDDFLSFYRNNPTLAAFDINSKEEAKKFGVILSDGDRVTEFEEKPENPRSTLVGTAFYLIPERFLSDLIFYAKDHSDDMGGIFEHLLSKKIEINVFKFKEQWFDIGSFSQFIEANLFFGKKHKGEDFVIIGESSTLESAQTSNASIGRSCKIKNVVIKNSVIFDNVSIKNAKIINSVIDSNCIISDLDIRDKMIRQNSVLLRH